MCKEDVFKENAKEITKPKESFSLEDIVDENYWEKL